MNHVACAEVFARLYITLVHEEVQVGRRSGRSNLLVDL